MAQIVLYSDNNVSFDEGPFVVCNIGGAYRIEAQIEGLTCPVLPDASIYPLTQRQGWKGNTSNMDLAMRVCDYLNDMVKQGQIVQDRGMWVHNKLGGK